MRPAAPTSELPDWGRFIAILIVFAVGMLAGLLALAYAVDPFDTGRSTLFAKPGVRPQNPRTAAPSRGRDPTYNAAVFGNSHVQLLSPVRLKEKTSLDFVQLSVPASGPQEHLVLVDWYLRHRPSPPRVLVLGADLTWCSGDPKLPPIRAFPFWLFSESLPEYLRGLLRQDVLDELPRRVRYVLADGERARPDGYWDYEPNYRGLGYLTDPVLRQRLAEQKELPAAYTGPFPAVERLRALVAKLPPETALVVIHPPVIINSQPAPGSPEAQGDQACKDAIRQALSGHPRTAVVDWRVDRSENRDPAMYFDHTHYRMPVAELIENDIAEVLNRLP